MITRLFILTILIFSSALCWPQDSLNFKWGGFIDTYYAYDFNNPSTIDRQYTTQAIRHNEFNINMAYVDLKISSEQIRSRMALQFGNSVEANYAQEPQQGNISGPEIIKHIQESYVGTKLDENTWIDAGIFFSHIGLESFISKDNINYTRSLVADFSPYYQAGVKISHDFSDKVSGQILLLNGWQMISDNNSDKTLGTQLSYNFSENTYLTYNTLIGNESTFRHFHDLVFRSALSNNFELSLQIDLGFSEKSNSNAYSRWFGTSLMTFYKLSLQSKINTRIEYYYDPDKVITSTGSTLSFDVFSCSLGFDHKINDFTTFRSEVRHYRSPNQIFSSSTIDKNKNTSFISSLGFSF